MKKEDQKMDYAHEIQQIFHYHYRNEWVSQAFINRHDRIWIQTFNDLVKGGFIRRKKTADGYIYKWIASYPEI